MGIRGLWDFLQENGIHGEVIPTKKLTTKLNDKPTIAVDFIGLFFESIRRHFLLVEQTDYDKAAAKVLTEVEVLLPEKDKFKLFINGFHTVERNSRSQKRNKWRFYAYKSLIRMINDGHYDVAKLKENIIRMRKSLAKMAQKLGWQAVYATGDSDVDIAKHGGTVISNDSDFLFFKDIPGVIFHHQHIEDELGHFVCYDKELVLDTLSLSEEKWVALGIVLTRDFNLSQAHLEIDDTYKALVDQKVDDDVRSVRIERYIKVISLRHHIVLNKSETRLSNYKIAFQIYVDMKQHLMDHNNIAEYYEDLIVQRRFFYFLKGFFFLF
ncbi:hypothetical protein K501DRAFT_271084 [Backusella circina FSU 941]|nr:hypothetical protein K501DRAFT_271084 [Backusella circina FSU 941]